MCVHCPLGQDIFDLHTSCVCMHEYLHINTYICMPSECALLFTLKKFYFDLDRYFISAMGKMLNLTHLWFITTKMSFHLKKKFKWKTKHKQCTALRPSFRKKKPKASEEATTILPIAALYVSRSGERDLILPEVKFMFSIPLDKEQNSEEKATAKKFQK